MDYDTAAMIRQARESRGWTRLDLFIESGIKPSTIEKHENGVEPGAQSWLAYSRAFGWPVPESVIQLDEPETSGSSRWSDHSRLDLQGHVPVLSLP